MRGDPRVLGYKEKEVILGYLHRAQLGRTLFLEYFHSSFNRVEFVQIGDWNLCVPHGIGVSTDPDAR